MVSSSSHPSVGACWAMQSPGIPTIPSGPTGQVLCTQVSRAMIQLPYLGMTGMPTPNIS